MFFLRICCYGGIRMRQFRRQERPNKVTKGIKDETRTRKHPGTKNTFYLHIRSYSSMGEGGCSTWDPSIVFCYQFFALLSFPRYAFSFISKLNIRYRYLKNIFEALLCLTHYVLLLCSKLSCIAARKPMVTIL